MNTSIEVALAVSILADGLCGGRAPNEIIVLCVCCYNDQDPTWSWGVHRAPDSAECQCCTQPNRWREGMVFAVRPRAAR